MRALGLFGVADADAGTPLPLIDGMPVWSAIVDVAEPAFDAAAPAFARQVVVRVSAFSCNYRDKGVISRMRSFPSSRFFPIGSEFAGTVVEVGAAVATLRPGDRVIGQNHYTGAGFDADGVMEGIPTNSGSREYQVFHESKLVRIPDAMPDHAAAAFSVGAQTAYSMVRKLDPQPGDNVLVTSATSNTSLFLISALKERGARVISTTSSTAFDDRLRAWGVDDVARNDPEHAALTALAVEIGGFHHVFDPFFDLHLQRAVMLMRPFGSYTTCGSYSQTPAAERSARAHTLDMKFTMDMVMVKNLTVVGNCLGFRADLEAALADYEAGRYACMVDSVFGGGDAPGFLDRTYQDRGRLGKVVYSYDDSLAA